MSWVWRGSGILAAIAWLKRWKASGTEAAPTGGFGCPGDGVHLTRLKGVARVRGRATGADVSCLKVLRRGTRRRPCAKSAKTRPQDTRYTRCRLRTCLVGSLRHPIRLPRGDCRLVSADPATSAESSPRTATALSAMRAQVDFVMPRRPE